MRWDDAYAAVDFTPVATESGGQGAVAASLRIDPTQLAKPFCAQETDSKIF
jgi:hypothetical protein